MTGAQGPAYQQKERNAVILLWIAFLVPGLIWFVQLNASYLVAAYACSQDQMWMLHLFFIAGSALAGAGVWAAWWSWRFYRNEMKNRQGKRFLALLALTLDVLFVLSILANELPNILLEPCT